MKMILDRKLQLVVGIMALLTVYSVYSIFFPHYKTVTIDSRTWECAVPSTRGIDAICVNYRYIGGAIDFNAK
jgi:hypothetical protein